MEYSTLFWIVLAIGISALVAYNSSGQSSTVDNTQGASKESPTLSDSVGPVGSVGPVSKAPIPASGIPAPAPASRIPAPAPASRIPAPAPTPNVPSILFPYVNLFATSLTRMVTARSSDWVIVFSPTFVDKIAISNNFGQTWLGVSVANDVKNRYSAISGLGTKIIVSKDDSTVYQSNDSGKTFSLFQNPSNKIWNVFTGNNDLSTLIVGVAGVSNNSEQLEFFMIKNNNIWKTLPVGKETRTIGCDETASTILYRGMNDNLCVSSDGGETWKTENVREERWVHCLSNYNGTVLLASSVLSGPDRNLTRVYRSTDKGNTWKIVYETDKYIVSLVMNRIGNRIAVTFEDMVEPIYLSKDMGETWIEVPGSINQVKRSTNKWGPIGLNTSGNQLLAFNGAANPINRVFTIDNN